MHTEGMENSQCGGSWSFSALSHPLFELGRSFGVSFRISFLESVENNSADPTYMFHVYILVTHHIPKMIDLEVSTHHFSLFKLKI